jgi:uncharacterized membrane protein
MQMMPSYMFPWVFPILFPIIFPMLFFFFFGRGMMSGKKMPFSLGDQEEKSNSSSSDNPALERLKMRLVNGEITKEQFEEMKKAIEK